MVLPAAVKSEQSWNKEKTANFTHYMGSVLKTWSTSVSNTALCVFGGSETNITALYDRIKDGKLDMILEWMMTETRALRSQRTT